MLAKHLDATPTHPGTTAGGSAAAERFASRFGATAHLVDGSGLARANRAAPRAVVRLLRGMYAATAGSSRTTTRSPVAGERGTL